MYTEFLLLHDTLKWLILFILVITLTKYITGWLGNRPWGKLDNILGISFVSLMDLQLIVGLVLYFFLSPITKMALSDFGTALKNADLRFFAAEHMAMMLIAVLIVHIGRAKSKKAKTDVAKFRTATIYYLIAIALIIAAIPWSRTL
jgi:hypothetical protein